ncbi:MAG: hypothetical protein AABX48_03450 [Nanoarchaeota archaeon]
MDKKSENVALFDMDGTLCGYDSALRKSLQELRSSYEPEIGDVFREEPDYIKNRIKLITSSEEWWAKLPRLKFGGDILKVARNLDYRIMILTQGPRRNPASWAGKKRWVDANLGEDTDVTITRDKGLVYGRVLVDDFPEYIERWLEWRKRGLVIMPANEGNKNYRHPQVIRYDGKNLSEVVQALQERRLE